MDGQLVTFVDTTGKTRNGVMVTCTECGTGFPSRRDQHRKYCSRPCVSAAKRRTRVTVLCDWCGEEIERTPSKAAVSAFNFCDRRCKELAQSNGVIVGNRVVGKDRVDYRKTARAAYPLLCADCGWDAVPGVLVVHHIDRDRENNTLENLVILCPTCHNVRHYEGKTGRWGQGCSSSIGGVV